MKPSILRNFIRISCAILFLTPSDALCLESSRIYQKAKAAVVRIEGESGSGTGFFLSDLPFVVTNHHVVDENPALKIKDSNGGPVKIKGIAYEDSDSDIAILATDRSGQGLSLNQNFKIGQKVYLLGNPVDLDFSISDGLISNAYQKSKRTILQFTAPIDHGSSGSPILDSQGLVVGIAHSVHRESRGFGFGAPAKAIQEALNAVLTLHEAHDRLSNDCIHKHNPAACYNIGEAALGTGRFAYASPWFHAACKMNFPDACGKHLLSQFYAREIGMDGFYEELGNECLKDENRIGCKLRRLLEETLLPGSRIDLDALRVDLGPAPLLFKRELMEILTEDLRIKAMKRLVPKADYFGFLSDDEGKESAKTFVAALMEIDLTRETAQSITTNTGAGFVEKTTKFTLETLRDRPETESESELLSVSKKVPYLFHFSTEHKDGSGIHEETLYIYGDPKKVLRISLIASAKDRQSVTKIMNRIKNGVRVIDEAKLLRFRSSIPKTWLAWSLLGLGFFSMAIILPRRRVLFFPEKLKERLRLPAILLSILLFAVFLGLILPDDESKNPAGLSGSLPAEGTTVMVNDYPASGSREAIVAFNEGNEAEKGFGGCRAAIPYYKKAIAIDSGYVKAIDNLALCFRKIGEIEEALRWYAKSLEIHPNGRVALTNIGSALLKKGNGELAAKIFLKLQEVAPGDPEGHYGAMLAYQKTKDYAAAVMHGEKALSLYRARGSDLTGECEYALALVYFNKGDESAGRLHLSEAKRLKYPVPEKADRGL